MKKIKIMLPLIVVLLTALSAILFSSFSRAAKKENKQPPVYYWYTVDYSTGSGRVPSGATPVFSGITQAAAQAADGCQDVLNQKHCLRGFTNIPATLPTSSYDDSTPKPN